jgi:hypothetical protein
VAGAVKGGLPQIGSSRAGVLDTKNILPEDAYLLPKERDGGGALAKDDGGNTIPINPGASNEDTRYVLMIQNTAPTGFKLVSDKGYTLNASSYYKVSVGVKTYGVPADGDNSRYGAMIALKGVEGAYFNGVRTEGAAASDEYKTYSFYILTGTNSLPFNFELGLGDPLKENTWSTGWSFYDGIKVETINKTEYDAESKRIKNDEPAERISLSFADTTAAVAETSEETVKPKSFWDWYWLPSLLFALAILAVLVNNLFKRVLPAIRRHRKPRLAAVPTYSRRADGGRRDRAVNYADDESYIDIDSAKTYAYDDEDADIAAEPDETEPYTNGGTAQAETAATADIGDAPDTAETEMAATTDGSELDTAETVTAPAEKPAPAKAAKTEPKKREKPAAAKAAKAKPEKERAGDYTDYFED